MHWVGMLGCVAGNRFVYKYCPDQFKNYSYFNSCHSRINYFYLINQSHQPNTNNEHHHENHISRHCRIRVRHVRVSQARRGRTGGCSRPGGRSRPVRQLVHVTQRGPFRGHPSRAGCRAPVRARLAVRRCTVRRCTVRRCTVRRCTVRRCTIRGRTLRILPVRRLRCPAGLLVRCAYAANTNETTTAKIERKEAKEYSLYLYDVFFSRHLTHKN